MMKKILPLILVSITMFSVSCSKKAKDDERLLGTWRLSSSNDGIKDYAFDSSFLSVTFNADRSCRFVSYNGEAKSTTYRIEGQMLYLNQKAALLGFDIDSSSFELSGNQVDFHKTVANRSNDFVFVKH